MARALGVSPSTVSNAYNRPDQLSGALRERVLRTAAELGYAGPDPFARNLRKARAEAVGLVFHDRLARAFDDPAAVQFLQAFTEVTDVAGLAVVLVPDLPDSHGAAVRSAAVDGFVLHGLSAADPLVAAAVARNLPTVVVDAPLLDGFAFVGIDDAGAAEIAIRHLVELGHRERLTARGYVHMTTTSWVRTPIPAAPGRASERGHVRTGMRLSLRWSA